LISDFLKNKGTFYKKKRLKDLQIKRQRYTFASLLKERANYFQNKQRKMLP
jgi:hypothetical protein